MTAENNDIHGYAHAVGVDHDTAVTHLLLFEIVGAMAIDDDKQSEAFETLRNLVNPHKLGESVRELAQQLAQPGPKDTESPENIGAEESPRAEGVRRMTRNEMKDLIRSLSQDDLETLRYLAMFGVDDWDGRTTINDEPWECPHCGAEGLLEVVDRVVEKWAAEEMTLHGDYEYDLDKSSKWDSSNYGDLYFECVKCHERFEVDELEEMFDVHCEENEEHENDEDEQDTAEEDEG